MSDLILPDFAGFAFERKRNPSFDTRIQKVASGTREIRANFDPYPLWHFTVPVEFFRNSWKYSEMDDFFGFYLSVRGRTDTWLYDCPNHNAIVAGALATGNGTDKQFQLIITHPYGFYEPIHNPRSDIQLFADGVLIESGYTLSATGVVTFGAAPASGVMLTFSGGYYHRCRFDADLPQFNESVKGIFNEEEFSFIGSPVNIL